MKASTMTNLKKTFLCSERDGRDPDCNYFGFLLFGEWGTDFLVFHYCHSPHRFAFVANIPSLGVS